MVTETESEVEELKGDDEPTEKLTAADRLKSMKNPLGGGKGRALSGFAISPAKPELNEEERQEEQMKAGSRSNLLGVYAHKPLQMGGRGGGRGRGGIRIEASCAR